MGSPAYTPPAMSEATKTDHLREVFLDVADGETVTESRQVETPSHDPVDDAAASLEADVSEVGRDGLADAIDGAEVSQAT